MGVRRTVNRAVLRSYIANNFGFPYRRRWCMGAPKAPGEPSRCPVPPPSTPGSRHGSPLRTGPHRWPAPLASTPSHYEIGLGGSRFPPWSSVFLRFHSTEGVGARLCNRLRRSPLNSLLQKTNYTTTDVNETPCYHSSND